MKRKIKLSIVVSTLLQTSIGIGFQGCVDLNIEIQQTARTLSEAKRDPTSKDIGDKQGSERMQGKNPTGISAKSDIASDTSKILNMDNDVTGPEK